MAYEEQVIYKKLFLMPEPGGLEGIAGTTRRKFRRRAEAVFVR